MRQSLDTIGAASGPLIAVILMSVSGQNFRFVFWLATIPGILAVTFLIVGISPQTNTKQVQQNSFRWNALKNLDRGYWMLVAVTLIFSLGNSSDAFLLLRSQQLGINNTLIPLTFMVMNAAYFVSAYPVGAISDKVGRNSLIIAGFLLYALVYLGFAFANTSWQIWSLFAVYGLYQGMTQGLLLAAIGDRVPVELRGTAFGALALATGIVQFPANLLAGILWEQIGYQASFIFASILAIVATLLLFKYSKLLNYRNLSEYR